MSDRYQLRDDHHLLPTPSGAYRAACTGMTESASRVLFNLMARASTRTIAADTLRQWGGFDSEDEALELLYHLQASHLIETLPEASEAPNGPLQECLPPLLHALSANGKALLADEEGIYVALTGFSHETAEELAALSAHLAILHQRHHGLLHRNLGFDDRCWALSDAAGNSQLGFWPLQIADIEFHLVIDGMPCFNQMAFRNLIWTLSFRYWHTPGLPAADPTPMPPA